MGEDKFYCSNAKRYRILRDRGMKISKASHRKVIQKYNYYNIINGYKDPFLLNQTIDKYKYGTTPNQLEALYLNEIRFYR